MSEQGPTHLSQRDIEAILPHRGSFLFIHEASIIVPGVKATAPLADITDHKYDFLEGHFPGWRINPGVIMAEACAQLLGIAAASGNKLAEGKIGVLAEINNFRFPGAAFPTDRVMLEAEVTHINRRLGEGHVRVLIEEKVTSEGDIKFALVDRKKLIAELQARMPKSDKLKGPAAANESQAIDIKNKVVVVFVIPKNEAPFYEEVGQRVGFVVEVVAEEGEYYLKGEVVNTQEAAEGADNAEERQALIIEPIVSEVPVGKGLVAISVQKPPSEADHATYLQALKDLE